MSDSTYGELAKRERHVLMIPTDLHEDCAVFAESSSDLSLERAVLEPLREASMQESVKNY